MTTPVRIFIIAGEASGDALGYGLMRALKDALPEVEFQGVGGGLMINEGLRTLFPMHELSVMGVAEILPKLFGLMKRIDQTAKEILRLKPDVVISIDSPDFCFRVIRKVKKKSRSIPCVHYVAPSVWAWRPGRAKNVSAFLDHILTLLPFEPPYFTEHGLGATFVGHPIVEKHHVGGNGERFRQKYGLKADQPILCMLPGSRMSEMSRLLEKFSDTADIVLQKKHHIAVVIPTLPHLKAHVDRFFFGRGINPIVTVEDGDKFDAFAASRVALAASGTVSLELAMYDTPHIIAYRLNGASAWIAKNFIKTPYVNLVNILLRRPAVSEFLLEKCEPALMAREILRLIEDKDARDTQLMDFRQALIKIGLGDPDMPSQKAAATVLRVIGRA